MVKAGVKQSLLSIEHLMVTVQHVYGLMTPGDQVIHLVLMDRMPLRCSSC